MVPIPLKLRKEINADPEYGFCMLRSYPGHICGGRRNTREHAIIVVGKRLQKKFAIISICAKAHEVDQFQDAHTMDKNLNRWVALNRASDQELIEISRAIDYLRERKRLNSIYGVYQPAALPAASGINY